MTSPVVLRRVAVHLATVVAVLAAALVTVAAPAGADPGVPSSMAATGDSISRAFDVNGSHFLSDDPAESWSTGTDSAVASQYTRLVAANPAMAGHAYNDARTGAVMADLDGQLKAAATQGVGYATVLMGANDLCTSSAATMTPTTTLQAQFALALRDFTTADPGATVFVASIPDLYQLWSTLHTNWWAETVWNVAGICPSMLSLLTTQAQRQQVVTREQADNAALAASCAQVSQCRWDGGATYAVRFPASDVSTVDYFHPDIAGQALLARTTWAAGPWPTLP